MGLSRARINLKAAALVAGGVAVISVFALLREKPSPSAPPEGDAIPSPGSRPRKPGTTALPAQAAARRSVATSQARQARPNPASCLDAAGYTCAHKIFSPDIENAQFISFDCVESEELGRRFCLQIQTYAYSSKAAANLPETRARDVQPGGQYNFEEFTCSHQQIRSKSGEYLKAEAKDLSSALLSTIKQCIDETGARRTGGGENEDRG